MVLKRDSPHPTIAVDVMTYLTLEHASLNSGSVSGGYQVYFSPSPPVVSFPAVWLDLHVGGDTYQACEDQYRRRPFRSSGPGQGYVRIRPHHSVRVTTVERVGLDQDHTAIVVNVASRAKHGLIVATGKVDPGFNPAPLLLVIYNQSDRPIKLRAGERIAAIAFAKLSATALPTSSTGHAQAPLGGDFEPPFFARVFERFRNADWSTLAWDTTKLIIAAVLTLSTLYLAYILGWRRS